jgi:hypothetical protein
MRLNILRGLAFILLGFALLTNSSSAQQIPQAEVLSYRVVEYMGGFQSEWKAADPTIFKGIVLLLKIDFTPEIKDILSSDFTLTFKSETKILKAFCLGVTIPPTSTPPTSWEGLWILNNLKEGEAFSLSVEKNCCTIYSSFLFVPFPNDTNELTLMYKDKILGQSIKIKREK